MFIRESLVFNCGEGYYNANFKQAIYINDQRKTSWYVIKPASLSFFLGKSQLDNGI